MLEGTPRPRHFAAIAALACAVRLFAAWAIPFGSAEGDPNFAPDENQHFAVVDDLAGGRAPVWPQSASVYSVFPPSQYAVQVATLFIARAIHGGAGIFWARLGSILLGIAGSLLLARAAGRFLRDPRAGALAGTATALYPQYAFVTAYCNADAWTLFAGLLLVDALAAWHARGGSGAGLGWVGTAAGAVLSAKVNGFYILLPAAIWVLARRPPADALAKAVALALAVASPWLIWNAVRTGGDAFGVRLYGRFMAEVWRPRTLLEIPHGAAKFFYLITSSAIGVFGNMSLPLPWPLRGAIGALVVIGAALAAMARPWPAGARFIAAAAVLNLGAELAKCLLVDFQPQGRYVLVSALLVVSVALLGPARERWAAWPRAFLAVLAVSAIAMEWQLATRGR